MATSAAKLKGRVQAWLAAAAALPALLAFGAGVDAGTDPFAPQVEFLPVHEAFIISVHVQQVQQVQQEPQRRLITRWTMPDGYYLYRSKFAVTLESEAGETLAPLALPDGVDKVDRYFGASEVYYGSVELSTPLAESAAPVAARISFQGCAEAGLCYPPQTRRIAFDPATGHPIMQ